MSRRGSGGSGSSNVLYYSPACPNSIRMLQALNELPELLNTFRIVDVVQATPQERSCLTHVPTILTSSGQMLVGSKCFDFLAQHQEEKTLVELPAAGFLSGATQFSMWDDFAGTATNGHMYCSLDEFAQPPRQ